MTKLIKSLNPFIGRLTLTAQELSQLVSLWNHLHKTPKHTAHDAEAKEMPTATVTVYNPTLTVSHSRRRELTRLLQTGFSIHF